MSQAVPVDHDPFSPAPEPVDYDPFAFPGMTSAPPMTTPEQAQNITSKLSQTWPARMAQSAYYSLTQLPDDLRSGKVNVSDPSNLNDDAVGKVLGASGLAMTGGLATGVEGDAGAILGAGPIRAYHGSPHDFDAFDLSKIGTGEGAQAYGHGLYFAGNENVAKGYRDALSQQYGPVWRDANGQSIDIDGLAGNAKRGDPQTLAASFLQQEPDVDSAISFARQLHPDAFSGASEKAATLQGLQAFKDAGLTKQPPGKMYQAQINADPEHFLYWDKPLSEQHPVVQQALANSPQIQAASVAQHFGYSPEEFMALPAERQSQLVQMAPDSAKVAFNPQHTGAHIYESSKLVPGDYRDPVAAAQALRDAGIPGIKYLDAGSRAAGDGTRNYVVFDDKMVDIIKKYGLAGLMAGGGARFALQPVDHDPFAAQ